MQENGKNPDSHTTLDRILGAIAGFLVLAVFGAIVGLFKGNVALFSSEASFGGMVPYILGFGLAGGVFSYFFPRPVAIFLAIVTFTDFHK